MYRIQLTKATLITVILSCLWGVASAQTTVADAKAAAIKKYPALGVVGSPLNLRCQQAIAERRKTNPAFFENAQWPLLIADELAGNPAPDQPTAPGSLAPSPTTEVKFTMGKISRSYGIDNGQPTSGINLTVRFSGPELAEAKGVRTTVKTATDDAGNALQKKKTLFAKDDSKFVALKKPLGSGRVKGEDADDFELELSFEMPAAMQSIKTLAGNIELVLPAKDPGSIVTASFAKDSGKPLKNAALAASGVEITLQKPSSEPSGSGTINGVPFKEYQLSYQFKDPQNKIASVEFVDASGTKLKSTGIGSSEFEGVKTASASFHVMPPPDSVAKIYLVTDRVVVTVPFDFKDIPIPAK